MNEDAIGCGFVGLFLGALLVGCVLGTGWANSRKDFEKEAVEAGHAEYVITDPATGATEFRWKENK